MSTATNIIRLIKKSLSELNLFEIETIRSEHFDLRKAILSTRIYIIFLTIILTILSFYTANGTENQTIIIQNPSQSDFENLYNKYSSTLTCPCKQITIQYSSFISVSLEYHPICSSIFVSDMWINSLFDPNISYYYPLDFRSTASGQFQILSSFCSLIKRFVNDAIDDFLSDTFLSPVVLSRQLLNIQSQTQSLFVRTSTNNVFRQLLQLIRSTTFSNQLQSAFQTSKALVLFIYNDIEIEMYTNQAIYLNINNTKCYCGSQSTCSSSISGFFNLFAYDIVGDYTFSMSLMANVTGFVVGCYAMESLLQSTLECLFDSVCLNTLLEFFSNIDITNIQHLDINQTQYSLQTNINTLINNLFLENWLTDSSFEKYYSKCAPVSCVYSFVQSNNVLYIITKLLGLYGGVVIVLRFCVPRIIIWCYKRNNTRPENNTRIRLNEHIRTVWQSVSNQIRQLNLFDKDIARNDPYELTTARIATRIYIILTCISTLILIIYGSQNAHRQTFTILNPSQSTFENLYSKYSDIIECPCKKIAIPYDSFVSLSPQYHPVCSSLFVSAAWLASTSGMNWLDEVFIYEDFKAVGQSFFTVIQTLCSLAETTVSNAWYNFKQSSYITDQTVAEKEVIARTYATLEQFQTNTIAEFKRSLALIRFHSMNMYASASANVNLGTSDSLNSSKEYIDFYYQSVNWSDCSCALSDECQNSIGFYEYPIAGSPFPNYLKFNIPNFYIGCFIIQSVLQSSLECFFNQTCLDAVQSEIRSSQSINISILEVNKTRFLPETLVQLLVDQLMLETWGENIQYNQYFQQCASELCTYTLTLQADISYIITLFIGLFGGITVALKIIVPFIVCSIRNRYRPHTEHNDHVIFRPTFLHRIHTMWDIVKKKIVEFNLFESELSWNDHLRRQKEIISTRIYFVLLTICAGILFIYISFLTVTENITIQQLSEEIFNHLRLNSRYVSTLECPCQQITISYSSFISIIPHFHQFCSSDFISMNSDWMNMLYSYGIDQEYPYDDFRLFALPQFRTLASLCILANQTLIDSLTLFFSKILISKKLQFRETIELQAQAAINQFRLSVSRTFVRMLDFIRYMAQGNGIVSAIQSNWYFHSISKIQESSLWTTPRSYGDQNDCFCTTNAMCTFPAAINGSSISGFRIGCYVLDSLLQTTLECLYNISCIDQIQTLYNFKNMMMIRPLNQSLSLPNETVQTLVDTLLIDQWKTNISYENYYVVCAPLSCTYSVTKRISPIYVVTTIISFYGGLTVVLKLVAPLLVKTRHYFFINRRKRVALVVAFISTNP